MLRLLLLVVSAYGAAIPSSPSCLERCLVTGGVVGAAADLNFFKSVAVDYNNFCSVYDSLLKCASECSPDDLVLVTKHTMHAAYACKDKIDAIKSFHDCLEADATDPLTDCSKMCQVGEHMPLRLDSSATAPVNPNTPMDGAAMICEKQMCVLKCSRTKLNKQCAGSGDLFNDMARHQVEIGFAQLKETSENGNDTQTQLASLSFLSNLPEKCMYLTNVEAFNKEVMSEMDKNKGIMPIDFANDTSVETESSVVTSSDEPMGAIAGVVDGPSETADKDTTIHDQPAPAVAPGVSGSTSMESKEGAPMTSAPSDTEAAMAPRTEGDGPTGLVPSGPVAADEDSEEEESSMGSASASVTSKSESKEMTETPMMGETDKSKEMPVHKEGETDSVDEQQEGSNSESKEGDEKMEGPGEMSMDASTSVTDTTNDILDTNKVEPTKMNGVGSSTVLLSVGMAVCSLLLL